MLWNNQHVCKAVKKNKAVLIATVISVVAALLIGQFSV
jgi:hypothetical protein